MLSAPLPDAPICQKGDCRVRTPHTHGPVSEQSIKSIRQFSDAIRVADYEQARRIAEKATADDQATGWMMTTYLNSWWVPPWGTLKVFVPPFVGRVAVRLKEVVRFKQWRQPLFHRPRTRADGHSYSSPVAGMGSPRLF